MLLDARLQELGDLAIPFDWGEPERAQYRTLLATARNKENLEISSTAYTAMIEEAAGRSRWEIAKQATRDTIGNQIRWKYGDDCWLLPRYGSLAALEAERSLIIPPSEREERRTRLTVLVGREFALPSHRRADTAYKLAIELAKDANFQRARRDLNTKQELSVIQEQSGRNDADDFNDLLNAFNAQVETHDQDARRSWVFTLLRIAKELVEVIEKPLSSIFGAAVELTETATGNDDVPTGPIAVFHHTKNRVFDPARA
jgi:hypothetical protein